MQATPIDIVQKQRIRIIAVLNHEAEQHEEMQRKQEEQEREMQRQQARAR